MHKKAQLKSTTHWNHLFIMCIFPSHHFYKSYELQQNTK